MRNHLEIYRSKINDMHGMGVLKGTLYELSIRAYLNSFIRKTAGEFFAVREPSDSWAFLVGCYNSGTTILRKIIGLHPEISTLPREGVRFTSAFPNLNSGGWRRMILRNIDLVELPLEKSDLIALQATKDWSPWWGDTPIFLEKSITHSVRMRFLEKAFGSPKFISIVRNGYCVAEGIRRRTSPIGKALEEVGNQYSMEMLAQQWTYINSQIRKDSGKVKYHHHISFEEFVENPVEILTSIFDFLGVSPVHISYNGETLSVNENRVVVKYPNERSIARLSQIDIKRFNKVGRSELLKNGYEVIS